jgi:hypothetical protein
MNVRCGGDDLYVWQFFIVPHLLLLHGNENSHKWFFKYMVVVGKVCFLPKLLWFCTGKNTHVSLHHMEKNCWLRRHNMGMFSF